MYVTLDERLATTSDPVVHVKVPYDPAPFVNDDSKVQARISYYPVAPILVLPWQARVDLVRWDVLN